MKKLNYTRAVTISVFGVFLWQGMVLVGKDKTGRIAFPGGKMDTSDKRNPRTTLKRETCQEVGKKLTYRHILSRPLIFATGTGEDHTRIENPAGQRVDLRYVYLLEVLNAHVINRQPKEISDLRFVDLAFFEDKACGIDTRYTVGYAMEMFLKLEHLPEPKYPLSTLDPDPVWAEERIQDLGFSPRFAHSYALTA